MQTKKVKFFFINKLVMYITSPPSNEPVGRKKDGSESTLYTYKSLTHSARNPITTFNT